MSVTTDKPRKRAFDYLFDPAFVVCGARDYARVAFKAAMQSGELHVQPIYSRMFSCNPRFPRVNYAFTPNCRLPDHIDTSYAGYLRRREHAQAMPKLDVDGKDMLKFVRTIIKNRKQVPLNQVEPDFHPATPVKTTSELGKPKNRGTQSLYRETSAQTIPWQPDYFISDTCKDKPEVLYLEELQWGRGKPYRTGDLPADFHTTEIINKKRHARLWMDIVEKGAFPRFMANREDIIEAVEWKDWVFREAEIDELQNIRLELLHRLKQQYNENMATKMRKKLASRWANAKTEMEDKIKKIRHSRDRELRKLTAQRNVGGKMGQAQALRATRGGGSTIAAACDPGSRMYAPLMRDGFQASGRHAVIYYDPNLIMLEDHEELSKLPPWLETCAQDLKKSCSGHILPLNPLQLCEHETKWSEAFLEKLHDDLRKARIGAAESLGPLHVLKPRRLQETPRPETPTVDKVPDYVENYHQAALLMQRLIRGRAVQSLMYEGRTRASELTQELKSTHGLQKEDQWRIAHEQAKAREYTVTNKKAEEKHDMISALLEEICGETVSAALDFLEKELGRLREERRHHAFILVALREKAMREAAEAGRRQKEERRRREHDEMFKQVLGLTQQSVDQYFNQFLEEGLELGAENAAVARAQDAADKFDTMINHSRSTADENELVAELVHQFLLPDAHKQAARQRLAAVQQARMDAVKNSMFEVLDSQQVMQHLCDRCHLPLENCVCITCKEKKLPVESKYRKEERWETIRRAKPKEKPPLAERYPPWYDLRNMLNLLVDDAVYIARAEMEEKKVIAYYLRETLEEQLELQLQPRQLLEMMIAIAVGDIKPPLKEPDSHFYMRRIIDDATGRKYPEPVSDKCTCPTELPSQLRHRALMAERDADPVCRCHPADGTESLKKYVSYASGMRSSHDIPSTRTRDDPVCLCGADKRMPPRTFLLERLSSEERRKLLPSELRELDEIRKCKCVVDTSSSDEDSQTSETHTIKNVREESPRENEDEEDLGL